MRREDRRPAARRRAVAAHGRRRQGAAAARRGAAARPGDRADAAAGRSARAQRQWRPGAVRRASACRSSPTACPISPGRSPGCWPGSTGPRRTARIALLSPASQPTRRFCREISSSRLRQGIDETGPTSPAPRRAASAHPVFGLWPVRLRDDLRRAVVEEGVRKVDVWTARYRLATVPFSASRSTRSSTRTGRRTWPQPRRCSSPIGTPIAPLPVAQASPGGYERELLGISPGCPAKA